jgi:hypothetical protein
VTICTRVVACALALAACACGDGRNQRAAALPPTPPTPAPTTPAPPPAPGSFADDVQFLRAHTDVVVLQSPDGSARLAIAPGYQGRVMTSTAAGEAGTSFGFIDRSVIALDARQPHMTVLGGEDRVWLGPEGGQFGLYFAPGAAFDTDHWQVPEPIDWGGWPVTSQAADTIVFAEPMTVTNASGTTFDLRVDRTIHLLAHDAIVQALGTAPGPTTHVVGFESDTRITNTGAVAWTKHTGLVSIWIIGQMRPTPETTIVVPFKTGSTRDLGPILHDAYFGRPPASRLKVGDGVVFFRADGVSRGKIGVPPPRARRVLGSYDASGRVLTIITFDMPPAPNGYVNSMWEHQADPYAGDVANAYNDGPLGPGQPPLGPFYELESSSPAAALASGESMGHVRRTIHLQGPEAELDAVSRAVLGVSVTDIASALPPSPAAAAAAQPAR